MPQQHRAIPNILITGTPGTGKTSTASAIAQQASVAQIGALVKEKGLHEGRDEEFDCFIIDEDKVCDELEGTMAAGGVIVDHHGCDFFPERWFDLVVVLRTDNSTLHGRLSKRGYAANKITENVECEIMQVVLDEATSSYQEDIVKELQSNTVEDMEKNVDMICLWIEQFKVNRNT